MKDLIIKIPIHGSDLSTVSNWVHEFNLQCLMRSNDAYVEGKFLNINAYDLSSFIGATKFSPQDEMTIFRLKRASIEALKLTICRRRGPTIKRNLLNAVKILEAEAPLAVGYDEELLKPRTQEKMQNV